MKTRAFLSVAIVLTAFNFLFSQIGKRGIPDDLKTSKVIFLKLDSADVSEVKLKNKKEKARVENQKKHNKKVSKVNNELIASSKKYPFNYVITHRSEIEKYKAAGYKYVLDFLPFTMIKEGEMRTDSDAPESYPLFLKDLTNGQIYIVDDVDQSFAYKYPAIFEEVFLREVKKKFQLK